MLRVYTDWVSRILFAKISDVQFLFVYRPDGEGQQCCYDNQIGGQIQTGLHSGGTVDRFASRNLTSPWGHRIHDIIPQIHCCVAPTSTEKSCLAYHSVRPTTNCASQGKCI